MGDRCYTAVETYTHGDNILYLAIEKQNSKYKIMHWFIVYFDVMDDHEEFSSKKNRFCI